MGYISIDQPKNTRILTTIVLVNDALPILVNEPILLSKVEILCRIVCVEFYVISNNNKKLNMECGSFEIIILLYLINRFSHLLF